MLKLKEEILKRCTEEDLSLLNDREYYFCVGNVLQDLKKCSKEFVKIDQSLGKCASTEGFDQMFKTYAKKCIATGLGNNFNSGTKKRKMLTAIFAYKPSTLDLDTFWDGFIIKL